MGRPATKWSDFNIQMQNQVKWREVAADILGLQLVGNREGSSGWIKCRSVDGDDNNPSASYNVQTGYYKDFRDGERAISSYDLMVQLDKAKDFIDAKKQIAQKFGVKWPPVAEKDPEYGVRWQEWSDMLAMRFCETKPPITIEGLKLAGTRMCMRYQNPCFALPIYDYNVTIVGWMFILKNGQPFQHEMAVGAKSISKIQNGVDYGFVTGPLVADALKDGYEKTVHWCEGPTDMLAGMSLYPKELFVTNPFGCQENVNEVQQLLITEHDHQCYIIGDCDTPGISGAAKKIAPLTVSSCQHGHVLVPPYEIAEKHGKDYRDYLFQVGTLESPIDGLVKLPQEKFEKAIVEAAKDNRELAEFDFKEDEAIQTENKELSRALKIIDRVGLIITAASPSGEMRLYCPHTNNVRKVKDHTFMKYANWIQFLGVRFSSFVCESLKEWEILNSPKTPMITFREFIRAVAIAATNSPLRDFESIGAGIWPVVDTDYELTGEVAIIKAGGVFKYGSDGSFTKLKMPVIGRNTCNIDTKYDWFDENELAVYIKEAKSVEWREKVYQELFNLFNQWRWENDSMSQLTIGMIMATAIQTLHTWRPIIAITGESCSGKTILLATINTLFGGLAQFSAGSTASGVFQNMGEDSRPLLVDEFDSGPEQKKLFRMFRAAGRGQDMLMGTVTHSGVSYRNRHIPWLSGIHATSKNQADLNRLIPLQLLSAERNKKTIKVPDARKLRELGTKMIAGIIVVSQAAIEIATQLNSPTEGDKIQSRYRESYAVPFGCLGAFLDLDQVGTKMTLDDYLVKHVVPEVEMLDTVTDQESLLLDIMQAEIKMPQGSPEDVASIAEILFDDRFEMHRDVARTKGVGYIVGRLGKYNGNFKVAFVGRRLNAKNSVLEGTNWKDIDGIYQILKRLPVDLKPIRERQMVAGSLSTCISVDYESLKEWVKRRGVLKKQKHEVPQKEVC